MNKDEIVVQAQNVTYVTKERNSNLELFRIITMIFIVAHHYVVNSKLFSETPIFSDPFSFKSIFLLVFGAFGKTGINCFVFITGFFMCKSNITLKKFLKLLFEFLFYKIVITSIFWITGYLPFNLEEILKLLFPVRTVASGFVGTYLFFFLTIPFLNILIRNLNEKMHLLAIIFSLFIYVGFETIPFFSISKNYIGWFIVLYFVSSYIRLYPKKLFDKTALFFILSLISIVLSAISVLACVWLSSKGYSVDHYYFVQDSNTLLAFTNGLFLFMFFKNVKIKNSKFINKIASTMFGVLLIHANSDAMRQFLWIDLFNNVGAFSNWWAPLHAIGTVIIVFITCVILDLIRIKFIEKPFFRFWDKKENKIIQKYKRIENKIIEKLNIEK